MNRTKIEYLDYTWNPTHGCSPVSEGCANCWAKSMAKRLAAIGARGYDPKDPFKPTVHPWVLDEPLKLKKPAMIGVSFMGDLFHEDIPFNFIDRVWSTFGSFCAAYPQFKIDRTNGHIFLVLTKKPKRMKQFLEQRPYPPGGMRNVWLGVTCENQEAADERIPVLLQIPAAVRFVSLEPLLEPVDLASIKVGIRHKPKGEKEPFYINALKGDYCFGDDGDYEFGNLNGVIAGCESGPRRRPSNIDNFRSLRDQCQEAGIPFFLKQMEVDGKVVHMPVLDGKVWDQMPGGSSKLKGERKKDG